MSNQEQEVSLYDEPEKNNAEKFVRLQEVFGRLENLEAEREKLKRERTRLQEELGLEKTKD